MGQASSRNGDDIVRWAHKKQQLDKAEALRRSNRDNLIMIDPDAVTFEDDSEDTRMPVDPEGFKQMLRKMGIKFVEEDNSPPFNSEAVVKINSTLQQPDYTLPWQTLDVSEARGSGAVIEGGYVLTAAHVIADYTYLEIQRGNDKCPAKVVGVCNDSDLALLKPTDDAFFQDIQPLKVGPMPPLRHRIYVAGFPIGGEEISVTEGVVSRIEIQPYSHSLKQLLAITVDAAINSGNSGGPVMNQHGELIGIAFQALEGAENVGHIVPPPVIRHFLDGIEKFGKDYRGFPDLGISVQTLENQNQRAYLGLPHELTGVLVVRVHFNNSCTNVLRPGDVLLKIGAHTIANNGMITFDTKLHGDFTLAVHQYQAGDAANLEIFREGKVQSVSVSLKYPHELVASHRYNVQPEYYIYCGLLFQPLSVDLLEAHFSGGLLSAPQELLYLSTQDETPERAEIVVLTRVFKDDVNFGYEALQFTVVRTINGTPIRSVAELTRAMESAEGEFLVLKGSNEATIVLPTRANKLAAKANKRISKRYGIKYDRSSLLVQEQNSADLTPSETEHKA